jgi:hypothetical protein
MNSAGDGMDKAREFATKTAVTYPLWHDDDGSYAAALKVSSLPMTLVADANGAIVWSTLGRVSETDLTNKLNELFP